MAKRVLLYGIRKEYSLKELPAIGKGIYGKPYFPEYPEICFNYSHADAGILCGIAETPLGVDIERLIHPTERLIRAVCHENEKKMLLAIEDPAVQIRYFSKIWTAKESYLKCIGTGIRQKLSNLDLSEVLDGKTYEEVYHFFFLDGEDFQAAVCLKTKKMLSNLSVIYMEENENGNQSDRKTVNSSSTSQYPPYVPVGNNDTWLSYYDAETNFSCQYPTNWRKITGAKGLTPSAEPPLLRLVNGANQLTVTALTYDTQKEFEHIKKLSLTLPRNAQGEPAEDYKQSNVNINGLSMTRTTNPLHIGAPDEPGEDIQQIVLHYFQESKKRTFTIVMLVYDEEAETDLNAITSSIQITQ